MTKSDLPRRFEIVFVCGGQWHDFEFARRRILDELGHNELIRVKIFQDYEFAGALDEADALVTYTCNLSPSPEQQGRIATFISGGGKWLALHATNALLIPPDPGAPRVFSISPHAGEYMQLLGSRFLAHPPMTSFTVHVSDPSHPLVDGFTSFEVTDELYVSEIYPPIHVLLHAEFSGACPSFEIGSTSDDDRRPILYLKPHGSGGVCYLTLGHCRGRYDLLDLGVPDLERAERGPWDVPEFRVILSRAVDWLIAAEAQ